MQPWRKRGPRKARDEGMLQAQVYAAVDGSGDLKPGGILLWKEGEGIQPIPDISVTEFP